MIRAPLSVTADPTHRARALRVWLAVAIGAPIVCWILNLALMAGLDQAPRSMLPYADLILRSITVNVILAVSLQLINGYTGQFSLGHAGFMAIGAYVSAALMYYVRPSFLGTGAAAGMVLFRDGGFEFHASGIGTNAFFLVTLILSGLAAAVAGLLVGIPSLRLKGDYLAIVTLGFGEIIRVIILNTDSLGASRGFSDLEPIADLYWVLLGAVAVVFVTRNMVVSTRGLAFVAVREDEIAAEAVGVNTTRYKVSAFVVGSFFAGIAGGLYAHVQAYISPGSFDFVKSMEIVAIVVLGGLGSIPGTIIAAAGLTLLPELLRGAFMPEFIRDAIPQAVWDRVPSWRMVIYSLILIGAMLVQARGAVYRRKRKTKAAETLAAGGEEPAG